MKRRVIWTRTARHNVLEIIRFITAENPAAARRVFAQIDQQGRTLGEFATGRSGRVDGTYEKVVVNLPYIIAYAIHKSPNVPETIVILRVIHTARDWREDEWPS
jgi:plasmid stabilization system protein ParE